MAFYTRINAIAFDIGGVLCHIDRTLLESLLKHYDVSPEVFFSEEFIKLQRGLINADNFFCLTHKKTNIPSSLLREAFIKMIGPSTYASLLNSLIIPYFFASNINQLHFEIFSKNLKLTPFCRRYSLLSHVVGHLKPTDNFFNFFALPFRRENILYIDDKKTNVKVAKQHGLVALHCPSTENLPRLLQIFFAKNSDVGKTHSTVMIAKNSITDAF